MAGGGFALHALKTAQANRALLRKRRSLKDIRKDYASFSNGTQLHFKELSLFEQQKIRDKIRQRARKNSIQETYVYLLSFVVAIGILYFLYWFATT